MPTSAAPSLVWFRNDLRLADNPALAAAVARGAPVLCIFILEEDNGLRPLGAASRWWLHNSLKTLSADIAASGGRLDLFKGAAGTIVPALVKAAGVGAAFWNRRYGGSARALDEAIAKALPDGCETQSFNGRLLHEPEDIKTKTGGPYGVYTPYWRSALERGLDDKPTKAPAKIEEARFPSRGGERVTLDDLDLLPTKPDWAAGFRERWTPGEAGAAERLKAFLRGDLSHYEDDRNQLAQAGTSHLSPHLRFGEISPRQIVAGVRAATKRKASAKPGTDKFLAELGWREFDYQALFHNPDLATRNIHPQFDAMPWRRVAKAELAAWQTGRTGYPIVDAGMRELWTTGYMHNRVRMITASFLIKHLLCDWRVGEQWFWDCLCDADPANNTMNWQWVAGSGLDASPFFRVFNPVLQGKRYDKDGGYVRAHVPELAKLPNSVIHEPWRAGEAVLAKAGVSLGETYPTPIIEHGEARARALDAYRKMRGAKPRPPRKS